MDVACEQQTDALRTYTPGELPPDQRDHLADNCRPMGGDDPTVPPIRTYTPGELAPDQRGNLGNNCLPLPSAVAGGQDRVQSLRTYTPGELPPDQRDHLADNCRPLGDDEADRQAAEARAEQSRAVLDQYAAARAMGREVCTQYPHGVPRRAMADLRSSGGLSAQLTDLPALDGASGLPRQW